MTVYTCAVVYFPFMVVFCLCIIHCIVLLHTRHVYTYMYVQAEHYKLMVSHKKNNSKTKLMDILRLLS